MRSKRSSCFVAAAFLLCVLSANVVGAQQVVDSRTALDSTNANQIANLVIKPVQGILSVPPHLDGAQFKTYLDGVGNSLFGSTFPGLLLFNSPEQVNVVYQGVSANGLVPFSFTTTQVDQVELAAGYRDPASSLVLDLRTVWVRGSLQVGGSTVSAGMLASTATLVADPSYRLTFLLPLGTNYPFSGTVQVPATNSGGANGVSTLERPVFEGMGALLGELESDFVGAAGDPCQGCYDDANRDLGRAKRDFKSCLKWSAIGGLAGGIVGLFGANPVTVIGGAALGAELVALNCAETYATTIGDIVEDFCACLASNECPPHHLCEPKP